MTDPLALDPVLPPRERSALPFNDDLPTMTSGTATSRST